MEETLTLTRTEIVAIFAQWRKDSAGSTEEGSPERDADIFIGYANAEPESLDEVDEQAAHEAAVEAGEKTEDEA